MLKYNISEIKNILYLKSQEYYTKKDELNNINGIFELYNELLLCFENITSIKENSESIGLILDTLYPKSKILYLFIDLNVALDNNSKRVIEEDYIDDINKKYNRLVSLIRDDYERIVLKREQLLTYLKTDSQKIYRYKIIMKRLKAQQIISDQDKTLLFETLGTQGYDIKERIKFMESIQKHNAMSRAKFKGVPVFYKKDVLNMLNFGFEIIEDDTVDYTGNVSKIVSLQHEQLHHYDNIKEFLNITQSMCGSIDEYKAVLIELLKLTQDEILEQINLIKEEEFYIDEEIKKEIIDEYHRHTDNYLHFRNEYLDLCQKDEEIVVPKENYLIYPKGENNKPYFVEDLKKIDKNSLLTIQMLLENLQSGQITKKQLEGFKTNYGEFRKLKHGQVRIIIKQVSKNVFMIVGVFIKKAQTGDLQYRKICNRKILDIRMEQLPNEIMNSETIQQEISEFIKENARFGNR